MLIIYRKILINIEINVTKKSVGQMLVAAQCNLKAELAEDMGRGAEEKKIERSEWLT
ncbi:MAG: hypothetical protein JW915_12135 [Chitinispirillaceae bacterium]|nr:hypothetical protein [Chitinispirillaceae bacterium]